MPPSYDYVIVGAGSAGCVLAYRLTEDPAVRVLLLEAGGPDRAREISIPVAFSKLFKTEVDWDYLTDPVPGLGGRRLYWPRGKVLGGSSSINAMIYIRGHPADYDEWAALGNDGWSYRDVLPYFRKAEDNTRGADAYHGTGGPLRVADLRSPHPLSLRFVEAAAEAGLPRNPDFNGAQQEGAGLCQVTQRRGRRWSTARAYLRPALRRPNLTVLTGAHATRILFDGRRAVGVAYVRERHEHSAHAAEVILSGGAVNSPQLLMLSGVGPAEALRRHGIGVVHALPDVGQNLQDHLTVVMCYRLTQGRPLNHAETLGQLARFVVQGRGMLTSTVAEALAFARSDAALPGPDLQYHFAPVDFHQHGLVPSRFDAMSLGVTLLRPKSIGAITLRSADPFDQPSIQPNFFDEAADEQAVLAGVRLGRQIFQARAFDAFRGEEVSPGAACTSDEELLEALRAEAEHIYHPVGTCAMGTGPAAVVDPRLRVRGVEGLRVVDASVMPMIVRGNTNAPTIMIAEKAADLIREQDVETSAQEASASASTSANA